MRKIGLALSCALWSVAFVVLLVSSGLLTGGVGAEGRARPIQIGELNDGYGVSTH